MSRYAKRFNDRLKAFNRRWGAVIQLAMGAFLLGVAAVAAFAAISVYNYRSYGDHLVHVSCERSIEFGPPIASFYEEEGILTPRQSRDYRRTIPTHC